MCGGKYDISLVANLLLSPMVKKKFEDLSRFIKVMNEYQAERFLWPTVYNHKHVNNVIATILACTATCHQYHFNSNTLIQFNTIAQNIHSILGVYMRMGIAVGNSWEWECKCHIFTRKNFFISNWRSLDIMSYLHPLLLQLIRLLLPWTSSINWLLVCQKRHVLLRSMQSLAWLVLAYLQSTFTVLQCTSLQMCVH